MIVDKAAAARFIKAGLVGQDSIHDVFCNPHAQPLTLSSLETINMTLNEPSNKQRSEQERISNLSKFRRKSCPSESQMRLKKQMESPIPLNLIQILPRNPRLLSLKKLHQLQWFIRRKSRR